MMVNHDKPVSKHVAAQDTNRSAPQSPGFALAARRVRTWTTNCLVSVMILVAGVGFGRQVLRWWEDGTGEGAAAGLPVVSNSLADPSARHFLGFGSSDWIMSRRAILADSRGALSRLRDETAALTRRTQLPGDTPGPAESRLIEWLAKQKPAQRGSGGWQIHTLEGTFPMVVGTRPVPSGGEATGGRELAGLARRVVTWGLGIPSKEEAWTLYTFHGVQAAEEWKRFYHRWFRRHGWDVDAWRKTGSSWHLRARRGDRPQPPTTDVQLRPGGHGRLAGIVATMPVGQTEKDTHP